MLIKENYKNYSSSINFIDSNDNFVGFDMGGQCCEQFGWYISREAIAFDDYGSSVELQEEDLVGYRFDTTFVDNYNFDETVVFRLVSDKGGVAYLHQFNSHNGYYRHGWESTMDGISREGYL